jgi:hypothetical protein
VNVLGETLRSFHLTSLLRFVLPVVALAFTVALVAFALIIYRLRRGPTPGSRRRIM